MSYDSKNKHPLVSPHESAIAGCVESEYAGMSSEETIEYLKREVLRLKDASSHYYATNLSANKSFDDKYGHIPQHGSSANDCLEELTQIHQLDNRPRLNTSSYVNVVLEKEESVRATGWDEIRA